MKLEGKCNKPKLMELVCQLDLERNAKEAGLIPASLFPL